MSAELALDQSLETAVLVGKGAEVADINVDPKTLPKPDIERNAKIESGNAKFTWEDDKIFELAYCLFTKCYLFGRSECIPVIGMPS